MHLTEILRRDLFWPNLKSTTKPEIIRELAQNISSVVKDLDTATIDSVIVERERLGSTGIQDGIAIPHGKIAGLEKIILACGVSKNGIDFESHDQKPTNLFFVLLAPEFAAGQHLKILARLSKLLKSSEFREKLVRSSDADEMYKAILEEDEKA